MRTKEGRGEGEGEGDGRRRGGADRKGGEGGEKERRGREGPGGERGEKERTGEGEAQYLSETCDEGGILLPHVLRDVPNGQERLFVEGNQRGGSLALWALHSQPLTWLP